MNGVFIMTQKTTILIVDDQFVMREALKGVLSNQGYELAFASQGEEALSKAAQLIPDMILLEAVLEKMKSLFQKTRKIRSRIN